jgi:tetratricopeptide (TPR) repeat protein
MKIVFKILLPFIFIVLFQGFTSASATDSLRIFQKKFQSGPDPSVKIHYLSKIVQEYWETDTDSALYYGRLGLSMLNKDVSSSLRGRLHFVYGIALKNQGIRDSAYWYLNKARSELSKRNNDFLFYRTLEQIGNFYREDGKYDSARILLEQAVDYFKKTNHTYQVNSSLINLGNTWLDLNRNFKAQSYYLEASSYDSILHDTVSMALTQLGIGIVYHNLGLLFENLNQQRSTEYFNTSLGYTKKSLALFNGISHRMGVTYATMNMTEVLISLKMFQQADSICKASPEYFNSDDGRVAMSFKLYSAKLLEVKGRRQEALQIMDEVSRMGNRLVFPYAYHEAMIRMAKLLREKKLTDSAYRLAERSVDWLRRKGIHAILYPALDMLSTWHNEDGRPAKALELFREASLSKDSLFIDAGHETFDELQLNFQKDIHLANLQADLNKQKLEHFRSRIAILLLVLLLLIFLVFILGLNQRRRKLAADSRLAEQKIQQTTRENKIKDSELRKIKTESELFEEKAVSRQLELQIKEQELVYQSLRQADISKFNKATIEKLIPFQFKITRKKDQEQFCQLIAEISHLSEQDALSDFEMMFSQMHGSFYEKLLLLAPDLSRSELQMCALLRMNLPSKEIARLMNLSLATVDLTRHHIRQKIKLESSQNLISFLIIM